MSEQNRDEIEIVFEGMVDVAATWLKVGLRLSETAISVTADGLQATAEAISALNDETESRPGRTS